MKIAESLEAVHTHTHTRIHIQMHYKKCMLICCIHNAMEKIVYLAEQCLAKTGLAFGVEKSIVVRKSTGANKNISFNKIKLGYLEMTQSF